MIYNEKTALETAAQLLQIKAIKLQPDDPFTWASGWKSPIYCDNRLALSHPETRDFLKEKMTAAILDTFGEPEVIAGVATGAIAMGVLVAQQLDLPFVYVRPKPKEHGRQNQIEGHLKSGQKTVVIEDLVSTGGSSLKAVDALRENGADVLGMAAIFTYGFPVSQENFKEKNCQLVTLSDYPHLLQNLKEKGELGEGSLAVLERWREKPEKWG